MQAHRNKLESRLETTHLCYKQRFERQTETVIAWAMLYSISLLSFKVHDLEDLASSTGSVHDSKVSLAIIVDENNVLQSCFLQVSKHEEWLRTTGQSSG